MKTIYRFTYLVFFSSSCHAAQIDLPRDAAGWTILTPSEDSHIVYVDPVSGDDTTCTDYLSSDSLIGDNPFNPTDGIVPCSTIAVAAGKLTNGKPDWLLIKRGTVLQERVYSNHKNGRSATEPFVMSAYGIGASPVLDSFTSSSSQLYIKDTSQWKVFSGLDFYTSARDPNSPNYSTNDNSYGFNLYASAGSTQQGILIEGCKFRFSTGNIGSNSSAALASGFTIRRNLFLDNYSGTSATGEAIFLGGFDDVLIEENIFDHNGWLIQGDGDSDGIPVGGATPRNQTMYFSRCPNIKIKGNIILRSSNSAIKLDSDELPATQNHFVYNNLIVDGNIGVNANDGDTDYDYRLYNVTLKDNVFSDLGASNPTSQKFGWAFYTRDLDIAHITGNLMINQRLDSIDSVKFFEIWGGCRSVIFRNNIAYNNKNLTGLYLRAGGDKDVSIMDNVISTAVSSGYTIVAGDAGPNSIDAQLLGYVIKDNRYHTNRDPDDRVKLNGSVITDADWFINTGDTSTFTSIDFRDQSRSIETYMAHIGKTATISEFVAECRTQSRDNWDTRFTAAEVNRWIRAGFFNIGGSLYPTGTLDASHPGTGRWLSN